MDQRLHVTITTVETDVDAKRLATEIIQNKLASCVQTENISSIYIWKEEIINENEKRLMIKHPRDTTTKLREFISDNHPYEVPEIFTIAGDINKDYGSWCHSYCE